MKKFAIEDSNGEARIAAYLDSHGFARLDKEHLYEKKPFPPKSEYPNGLYITKERLFLDDGRWAFPDFEVIMDDCYCSIEFDGQEHFKPVEVFGGISGFISSHEGDLRKDQHWEEKKCPHLRIRYNQYDEIEERLDDFFAHLEDYIAKHSRDDWDNYYGEWRTNFDAFLKQQAVNPDKRYIIELIKEDPIIYYFADIKSGRQKPKETLIML